MNIVEKFFEFLEAESIVFANRYENKNGCKHPYEPRSAKNIVNDLSTFEVLQAFSDYIDETKQIESN